jgi:GT2 family glycosyltransferase
MSYNPLVYIIILNWNGWQDTLACVESCRKLTWPNFRIVVVDNGSTDGSESILRERLPDVEIIQSGANLGFAGGNNVGIRRALDAGADYVWLLNNDAEAAPEALTGLVETMESASGAGMASSKIYLYDDPQRLDFAGGLWEKGRLRVRLVGANQVDSGQFDEPPERSSVSGCSVLVSSRMIRDIGLMDESYFLYWEDTEWCARAQQKGYAILFAPKSHVWHKVSASTGKNSFAQHYYLFRNGLFFLRRYDPWLLPLFAVNNLLFGFKCLSTGKSQPLRGFIHGFADFLRGRTGPMKDTLRES